MDPRTLASTLDKRLIVVKDIPMDDLRFDENGLKSVCPLYSTVEMQGKPPNAFSSFQLK